jgi:hypothetical protein
MNRDPRVLDPADSVLGAGISSTGRRDEQRSRSEIRAAARQSRFEFSLKGPVRPNSVAL